MKKVTSAFVLSTTSVVELSVAAVLLILTLVFGISAYRDFTYSSSFAKALRFEASRHWEKAVPLLERAVDARPDEPGARLLLAKIDCMSGNPHRAMTLYEELSKSSRSSQIAKVSFAIAAMCLADQKGEGSYLDRAAEALGRFDEGEILVAEVYSALAQLALRKQDFARVRTVLERMRSAGLLPGREGLVDAHAALGVLHVREGTPAEALAEFRRVLQLAPDWPLALENVARLYAKRLAEDPLFTLEDFRDRERDFKDLIGRIGSLRWRGPDLEQLSQSSVRQLYAGLCLLGLRYRSADLFREASDGLLGQDTSVETLLLVAQLCQRMAAEPSLMPDAQRGWLLRAKDRFRDLLRLQLDPKTRRCVLNNAAYLLFVTEGSSDAVTNYLEQAIKLDPQSAEVLRNLAIAYGKHPKPDFDKALDYLERSLQADPDQPDLRSLRLSFEQKRS